MGHFYPFKNDQIVAESGRQAERVNARLRAQIAELRRSLKGQCPRLIVARGKKSSRLGRQSKRCSDTCINFAATVLKCRHPIVFDGYKKC